MTDPAAVPSADSRKTATTKGKADEGVPVHAIAPDLTPTGPSTPLGKPPEPSRAQKEASEMRAKVGACVQWLQRPPHGLRPLGAALLVAHMTVELGTEAVSKLDEAKVGEYGANFRARYPAAWGAMFQGNLANFCRFLRAYGLRGGEGDAMPLEQMVVEYQRTMSMLAPQA